MVSGGGQGGIMIPQPQVRGHAGEQRHYEGKVSSRMLSFSPQLFESCGLFLRANLLREMEIGLTMCVCMCVWWASAI